MCGWSAGATLPNLSFITSRNSHSMKSRDASSKVLYRFAAGHCALKYQSGIEGVKFNLVIILNCVEVSDRARNRMVQSHGSDTR